MRKYGHQVITGRPYVAKGVLNPSLFLLAIKIPQAYLVSTATRHSAEVAFHFMQRVLRQVAQSEFVQAFHEDCDKASISHTMQTAAVAQYLLTHPESQPCEIPLCLR